MLLEKSLKNKTAESTTHSYGRLLQQKRLYYKLYRNLNKEYIRDRFQKYYEKNKEQLLLNEKKYNETHKETFKEKIIKFIEKTTYNLKKKRKYNEAHKEDIKEHNQQHYKNNKEQINEKKRSKINCPQCGQELSKASILYQKKSCPNRTI